MNGHSTIIELLSSRGAKGKKVSTYNNVHNVIRDVLIIESASVSVANY